MPSVDELLDLQMTIPDPLYEAMRTALLEARLVASRLVSQVATLEMALEREIRASQSLLSEFRAVIEEVAAWNAWVATQPAVRSR